ncbi:DEAD/DEAH box helicase [Pirellulaceae bacterium SH501]
MDVFEECHDINSLLLLGSEDQARSRVILLLDYLESVEQTPPPIVNSLVRQVGLYPYINFDSATWQDRLVYEAFKVDTGDVVEVTLHREQSRLLKALIDGKSVAVSAPTSFGKSFVIDSFISMRNPKNVVILVPTVALTDETRRRLTRKFGGDYRIITAPEQKLGDRNILIFPQERSGGYTKLLQSIDILIVDEFYKASTAFDADRSPSLIRAIIDLGKVAKQKYFLAPNIDEIKDNPFTEGMEFIRLEFNTVVLKSNDMSSQIRDETSKSEALLGILKEVPGKTLVYAGTYANISRLETLLLTSLETKKRQLLSQFEDWLAKNYDSNWPLTKLVSRGVGIHNGRLHRSLGQIQIKLFEESLGLETLLSTSSIIEGVNTSAETVVLWSNKNGSAKLNDFTYKNIVGRSGRMFRHFVGNIFILEPPPDSTTNQLQLEFPNDLLGLVNESNSNLEFTPAQVAAIELYRDELRELVGPENFKFFEEEGEFQTSSTSTIIRVAKDIVENRKSWNGLGNLNSANPDYWTSLLYRLIRIQAGAWGIEYSKFVEFVKVLSLNWQSTIPQLLRRLEPYDIGLDQFFELERNVTFKLAATLADVQTIYRRIHTDVDVSLAISRFTNAFLPPIVHQLEEYGLPRMVSRKIHRSGIVDMESYTGDIADMLMVFRSIGQDVITSKCVELDDFDKYILDYFFDGIKQRPLPSAER